MTQAAKSRPPSAAPAGSGSRFSKPQETPTEHQQEELDEALAESFPASDPPAMTNPSRKVKTPAPASDPVKKAAKCVSDELKAGSDKLK
jgi:hypothetical protein